MNTNASQQKRQKRSPKPASKVTRLAMYADLHGVPGEVVDCDLALVAGDVCPEFDRDPVKQLAWLETSFLPWLERFPHAVWVAGNHDYACDAFDGLLRARYGPATQDHGGTRFYLQDEGVTVCGFRVWGSPWCLPCGENSCYPFTADEDALGRRLAGVKDYRPHILVSHGPAYGCLDGGVGSRALLAVVEEAKPWLLVNGHMHEYRGCYGNPKLIGPTIIFNAANRQKRQPITFDMDDEGRFLGLKGV